MKYIKLTREVIHPYSQMALFVVGDVLTTKAAQTLFAITGMDTVTGDYTRTRPTDQPVIDSDCAMRVITTHDNVIHTFKF